MPSIIMMTGEHRNPEAIDNLIDYIYDSPFCYTVNSYMTISYSKKAIADSFKIVQNYYDKTDGKKIHHIVIGFSDKDGVTTNGLLFIAEEAAKYISRRFQCCYGIHLSSQNHPGYWHIHLAINTISLFDGKRYYENWQLLYDLMAYLDDVTERKFRWYTEMKESAPYVPDYQCGSFVYDQQDIINQDRL